jgi:DNA helicase-2/ATP-dependent DNA helicase PcrA
MHQKLDEKEMQLQVALYAAAAKKELEYQPEQGLVRYLAAEEESKAELQVPLDDKSIRKAKSTVALTARKVRDREFISGPTGAPRNPKYGTRCAECDFKEFCGMDAAREYRGSRIK